MHIFAIDHIILLDLVYYVTVRTNPELFAYFRQMHNSKGTVADIDITFKKHTPKDTAQDFVEELYTQDGR